MRHWSVLLLVLGAALRAQDHPLTWEDFLLVLEEGAAYRQVLLEGEIDRPLDGPTWSVEAGASAEALPQPDGDLPFRLGPEATVDLSWAGFQLRVGGRSWNYRDEPWSWPPTGWQAQVQLALPLWPPSLRGASWRHRAWNKRVQQRELGWKMEMLGHFVDWALFHRQWELNRARLAAAEARVGRLRDLVRGQEAPLLRLREEEASWRNLREEVSHLARQLEHLYSALKVELELEWPRYRPVLDLNPREEPRPGLTPEETALALARVELEESLRARAPHLQLGFTWTQSAPGVVRAEASALVRWQPRGDEGKLATGLELLHLQAQQSRAQWERARLEAERTEARLQERIHHLDEEILYRREVITTLAGVSNPPLEVLEQLWRWEDRLWEAQLRLAQAEVERFLVKVRRQLLGEALSLP